MSFFKTVLAESDVSLARVALQECAPIDDVKDEE